MRDFHAVQGNRLGTVEITGQSTKVVADVLVHPGSDAIRATGTDCREHVSTWQFGFDGSRVACIDHGILQRDFLEALGHSHLLERSNHVGNAARLVGQKLINDVDDLFATPRLFCRDFLPRIGSDVVGFTGEAVAYAERQRATVLVATNTTTQEAIIRCTVRVAQTVGRDQLDSGVERATAFLDPLGSTEHFTRDDEATNGETDKPGERVLAGSVEPALFGLTSRVEAGLDDHLKFFSPSLICTEQAPIRFRVETVL